MEGSRHRTGHDSIGEGEIQLTNSQGKSVTIPANYAEKLQDWFQQSGQTDMPQNLRNELRDFFTS